MTQGLKEEIIQAAIAYMKEKALSANDLSKLSSINAGYLSNMLRGIFSVKVGDKDTTIQDKWFKRLATTIGFELETVVWGTELTPQFKIGIDTLLNAKENALCGMIIGDTGTGKTYLVDKFCLKNPAHTYRITVSSLHNLTNVLDDLIEVLGIDDEKRKFKIDLIARHILKLKFQGESVLIIFDEAENLRIDVFRMLKALYDKIADHCAIQLIGTRDLITKLERLKKENRYGIAQFHRRFKVGTRYLPDIDKNYDLFLNKHVQEPGLRRLLTTLCDNYGELHDYLFPVMREAKEQNKPLTEDLFRLYHNMPKKQSQY